MGYLREFENELGNFINEVRNDLLLQRLLLGGGKKAEVALSEIRSTRSAYLLLKLRKGRLELIAGQELWAVPFTRKRVIEGYQVQDGKYQEFLGELSMQNPKIRAIREAYFFMGMDTALGIREARRGKFGLFTGIEIPNHAEIIEAAVLSGQTYARERLVQLEAVQLIRKKGKKVIDFPGIRPS